jgi:DNA-binding XRE family transcriptional regulator
MDKRYKPLTPLEQLHAREQMLTTIQAHPEWTFAETVRHVRKSLRMTIKDMAKVGKLSYDALRNIETSKSSPTLETATRLLNPFGLRLCVTPQQEGKKADSPM